MYKPHISYKYSSNRFVLFVPRNITQRRIQNPAKHEHAVFSKNS